MFKIINEYLSMVKLEVNDTTYNKLSEFKRGYSDIEKCNINVNYNRYVVDIKLEAFSVERVAEIFGSFNNQISYPYTSIYVRYNEGNCVRYRYITCKEDKTGFYCDIIFS